MRLVLVLYAAAWALGAERVESFTVHDTEGKPAQVRLAGQPAVVIFLSTICPISNEYNARLSTLYQQYSAKGVRFAFLNANSNETAADVRTHAKAAEFPFPVYRDAGNVVADRLEAEVTPEAYLFDRDGVLRYRGAFDDARNPARVKVQGLRDALEEVLAGKPVTRARTKAFGCTIKRLKKSS